MSSIFLSSEEGQKIIAAAGSKPAMGTDAVKQVWADNIEVYTPEMVDLYFEPVKVFSDPMNEAGPFAATILTEELSLYMTEGGQDLDTTIANSVARIEDEIANLG
jgi:multiple sugar transport system substrate-binding protein